MAARYWRGGSGTWSSTNTTNWSATNGGAGGASVPGAADTVFVTSLSGSPTITMATAYNPTIISLTTTGATCTLASGTSGATITITGGLTLSSTTTMSGTAGTINCTNTQTVNTGGITINGWSLNLGAVGSTITLGSNIIVNTFTMNHNGGTLVLNGFNITAGGFSCISGTRAIQFGASNTITTNNSNGLQITGTGFSYTGTSKFIISGTTGASITLTTGFTTANAVNVFIQNTLGTVTDTNAVYNNLDHTGCTGTISNAARTIYGSFTAASGATYTAGTSVTSFSLSTGGSQTLTSNGKTLDFPITHGQNSVLTISGNLTMGATRTYTQSQGTTALGTSTLSCGLLASSGGNFTFSGAGNIVITGNNATVFNQTNNVNFNSIPINFTYNLGTGTRTITQTVATASLQPTFNFTAGTDIIAYNPVVTNGVAAVNLTGFGGTFNGATSSTVFAYNFTQNAATTVTVSNLRIAAANSYTLTAGTFTLGTSANTFGSFLSNNSNVRAISFPTGSGAWTLSGTGTVWNTSTLTNLTVTIGSTVATITLSGSTPTFAGGGINLTSGTGGIGIQASSFSSFTLTGANTFYGMTLTSAGGTVTFPAGVTTTAGVLGGSLNWTGAGLGSEILIRSSSPGTKAILSAVSAVSTSFTYLNIQDSQAQGGATWTANNSIDNGNNTGWTFPAAPGGANSNYFLMF